jgi:hypothetical protein
LLFCCMRAAKMSVEVMGSSKTGVDMPEVAGEAVSDLIPKISFKRSLFWIAECLLRRYLCLELQFFQGERKILLVH